MINFSKIWNSFKWACARLKHRYRKYAYEKALLFGENVELKTKNEQQLSLKSFQKAPKLQLLYKNLKNFGDAYMPWPLVPLLSINCFNLTRCAVFTVPLPLLL